jgi:hypothetical protein
MGRCEAAHGRSNWQFGFIDWREIKHRRCEPPQRDCYWQATNKSFIDLSGLENVLEVLREWREPAASARFGWRAEAQVDGPRVGDRDPAAKLLTQVLTVVERETSKSSLCWG